MEVVDDVLAFWANTPERVDDNQSRAKTHDTLERIMSEKNGREGPSKNKSDRQVLKRLRPTRN